MAALKEIPTRAALYALMGEEKLSAWERMARTVDSLYDMETLWSDGGQRWAVEYKYRRGGKTLCCLYAKAGGFGLMLIFGLEERARVDAIRHALSAGTVRAYDEAQTYHDGKWVMFDETLPNEDLIRLLAVKRKPNRAGC